MCTANRLTGFYMRAPLAFNGLRKASQSQQKIWRNQRSRFFSCLGFILIIFLVIQPLPVSVKYFKQSESTNQIPDFQHPTSLLNFMATNRIAEFHGNQSKPQDSPPLELDSPHSIEIVNFLGSISPIPTCLISIKIILSTTFHNNLYMQFVHTFPIGLEHDAYYLSPDAFTYIVSIYLFLHTYIYSFLILVFLEIAVL